MRGTLATRDHAVLVRKQGDTARRAPCCRYSSHVVAQQLGRPVHHTQFRPAALAPLFAALGWDSGYTEGEDLEAERLFDYGLLAPPAPSHPLEALTCADARLAGAGGQAVLQRSTEHRTLFLACSPVGTPFRSERITEARPIASDPNV